MGGNLAKSANKPRRISVYKIISDLTKSYRKKTISGSLDTKNTKNTKNTKKYKKIQKYKKGNMGGKKQRSFLEQRETSVSVDCGR